MSRVAVAQMKASTSKSENLGAALRYIAEAGSRNADLIAFPEFLMAYSPRDQPAEELAEIAETVDGEFASALRSAAKKSRISIAATIYEKSQEKKKVHDTALLIDSDGNLSLVYRKLHLYDALGFRESEKLAAGEDLAVPVRTASGNLGMMICYDIRFPELSRILALMGADTLILPSAWVQGEMKIEHWQTMIRARAIENGCYIVAPDQVGNIYIGRSMVVDPFGKVLLDMREREGIDVVDLDPGVVGDVRSRLPLLGGRREDVYSKYFGKLKAKGS